MFKLPVRKVKIELYIDLSTEEAHILVNLHNKRTTSKKVFFQVSMSFMIFLWIFYFGGGVGVSGHHFPYLLFTSIINPHLLYLHLFFLIGGRSWERVLLLPSLLTSYYFVFFHYHTQPPPLQLHWFFCVGIWVTLEFVFNAFWKEYNGKIFWKFIDNLYKE